MAIDTKPFVELAYCNRDIRVSTHFDGCEVEHTDCAILYLAGALDAAQKRLDEYLAEIERLRAIEAKAIEQSEYIQTHGLTDFEMSRLKDGLAGAYAEIERLRAEVERLREAIAGCLLLADNYTENENVRLALISQRCRDELKGGGDAN